MNIDAKIPTTGTELENPRQLQTYILIDPGYVAYQRNPKLQLNDVLRDQIYNPPLELKYLPATDDRPELVMINTEGDVYGGDLILSSDEGHIWSAPGNDSGSLVIMALKDAKTVKFVDNWQLVVRPRADLYTTFRTGQTLKEIANNFWIFGRDEPDNGQYTEADFY